MIFRLMKLHILIFFLICAPGSTVAQQEEHGEVAHSDEGHSESFVAGEYIFHHIADANEIHFFGDVSLPLPIILYTEGEGFDIFLSNSFQTTEGVYDTHYDMLAEGPLTGLEFKKSKDGGITATDESKSVWDISITKSVFGMFCMMALVMFLMIKVARSYAKNPGKAPTGLTNFLEPLILFVVNDIAVACLGKERSKQFLPFLLTAFFFITASNFLGLIPFLGGFNITGTIGVTIVLATSVFIITTFKGNKHYWGHMFNPPGVPGVVKLIVIPIEVAQIFIKPIVLMIRLTANISAGHIIILSFVSLIYIFSNLGEAVGTGLAVGVFSTLFMIFMYLLEFLFAFLQAYVFTLLAAIYFADATQEATH
ncbi:MAG TPA: ATP synthase F0 subunit A [Flavobacteriales bacterium]|nr:F0F1 ATP synthase subunit A [Flavobacteriales bacterium]HIK68173.1 ATP synthase F0 subunit A [Flavobacteriales bacterium]